MIRVNQTALEAPIFRKLSDDQLARIHAASLEILERTGARLHDGEAVALFEKAGADVTDGNLVRIPSYLVEWALRTAPKTITLCSRDGSRAMHLEGHNVYYGPGSDCPNVIDLETGERRLARLADVRNGVRLCDALPNIDFIMSFCMAQDVPQEVSDRYQMREILLNSTKPSMFVTLSMEGARDAVEMARAVAGGADALRRRPITSCYVNVTGPLRHNQESLQKLLYFSEIGLPFSYIPVVLRGLNGPATLAGALALGNAGELVGVVLSQLKREGAPIIVSGGTNDMVDMRSLVGAYAAPESRVMFMEMVHYHGLPMFGLGGASDSKLPDEQAAAEAALSLLTETLAGSHMVHDVGYLASGMLASYEQVVICDELINWVRRFVEGVVVDDETLALDLIDRLGPDGDYVSADHTLDHFREDYYPAILDRQNIDRWEKKGRKTLRERAVERAREILVEHEPEPLPGDLAAELDRIVEEAEAAL
jgi:trimethylamine--corrinoid protein Co-methyltransferase